MIRPPLRSLLAHAVMLAAMAAAMNHAASTVWGVSSGVALLLSLPLLVVVLRGHPTRGDHLLDVAGMAGLLLLPVLVARSGGDSSITVHVHGVASPADGGMSAHDGQDPLGAWVVTVSWAAARVVAALRTGRRAAALLSPGGAPPAHRRWSRAASAAVAAAAMALMVPL